MNPFLSKVIRNEHQRQKYQQLEDLASQVTEGVIVELGTYLGYGTIALCTGAQVPVYTVDDYQLKQGWACETYHPADKERFELHCKEAGIEPVFLQHDVRFVATNWHTLDISLLVWDLGMPYRLEGDFIAWFRHVTGKFVIHDTGDQRLGSDLLDPIGWKKYKEGVFWMLIRES